MTDTTAPRTAARDLLEQCLVAESWGSRGPTPDEVYDAIRAEVSAPLIVVARAAQERAARYRRQRDHLLQRHAVHDWAKCPPCLDRKRLDDAEIMATPE